ncbi:MAG: hypothetical protein MN733_30525, partial [Nitrososphaera sp.]|nr:hypothetical protein [Nitrososphaera sp.]
LLTGARREIVLLPRRNGEKDAIASLSTKEYSLWEKRIPLFGECILRIATRGRSNELFPTRKTGTICTTR